MTIDNMLMIGLGVILFVALLLLAYISKSSKKTGFLDRKFYGREWARIEQLQKQGGAGWQLSIIEADKLLDQALKACGHPGETMGDRLKGARGVFKSNDQVWQAHKLRNRLAHESGVRVNGIAVAQTLRQFKNGLKDLGAL